MPIYEYRCADCGSTSEFLVSRMGAKPADLKCGQCGGSNMDKALSTVAVHQQSAGPACQDGQCPVPAGQRGCCGGQCNL